MWVWPLARRLFFSQSASSLALREQHQILISRPIAVNWSRLTSTDERAELGAIKLGSLLPRGEVATALHHPAPDDGG